MTPTPGLHACPGSYITARVFGYTPDCRVPRLKRKGPPRQTIYNPARRHFTCHFKLLVRQTDCTPLQSHLTGCLVYSPIGKTLRPILLGRTLSSQGSPSHRAPQVRPRPCGLGQPWYTASSPWPRLPWHLDDRSISSIIGSAAMLP